MNLYDQFETNSQCESDGLYIDYGKNDKGEDIRFKIARAGGKNTAFAKSMERHTKPIRRLIDMNLLAPAKAEEITRKVFIESVLKGWEGVQDKAGANIPFTAENAERLFSELPDLFINLQEQARDASIFREAINEEDAKN